ncbi:MAG TPA: UDP-N-acetylglucosamine 1-carboxyvinyltransferase [Firmicutes bacterium]|nr:UDP-N-acetylglucosamine 1-carboxyvinyltransferase [Candidatus Fermentithermobacillaceae bacterium]
MARFVIEGGIPIKGSVSVSGAKNAVLPMMAASVMASKPCLIQNAPHLVDVEIMAAILTSIGVHVRWTGVTGNDLYIDPSGLRSHVVDEALMRKVRSSIFLMGPLLARLGKVEVSHPGGCDIGPRPIDLHLKGLRAMGAQFEESHGRILGVAGSWKGVDIHLDIPSVGATENIMMGACLAEGLTIIRNAAKEPEVVDLQGFLNSMGASVRGAGTDVIRVEGLKSLKGAVYSVMPDRIEAGTFMAMAAITGGEIWIRNAIAEHVQAVIAKLRETGTAVIEKPNGLFVKGPRRPLPTDVKTLPYPGFPTDMQPQMMALLTLADGTSVITETVFDSRFKQAEELGRMGARIRVDGRTAIIKGVPALSGAQVEATDLRSGASLVLAALAAEGVTVVTGIHNMDRGYEKFEDKIKALGGSITRVD